MYENIFFSESFFFLNKTQIDCKVHQRVNVYLKPRSERNKTSFINQTFKGVIGLCVALKIDQII